MACLPLSTSATSQMRGNATGDEGTLQETGQQLHLSVLTVLLLGAQARLSNDGNCKRSPKLVIWVGRLARSEPISKNGQREAIVRCENATSSRPKKCSP